jgi:hypothetical protein
LHSGFWILSQGTSGLHAELWICILDSGFWLRALPACTLNSGFAFWILDSGSGPFRLAR